MPMTAMIRNLGKMTSIELLGDGTDQASLVCKNLKDEELLRKARIHPFNVLLALKQYQAGHGDRGKLTWTPNKDIAKALEAAFYLAFKVETSFLNNLCHDTQWSLGKCDLSVN